MLKLKLKYFGHLMLRANSLEKTLMLGKIERKRRERQKMRWLDGITDLMDMSLSKLQVDDGHGHLTCCSPWGRKESDKTEQMNGLIYLAELGLSCGTRDLHCIWYLFSLHGLSSCDVQDVQCSVITVCGLSCSVACGILIP